MFQFKILGAALAASLVLVLAALGIRSGINADLIDRAESSLLESTEAVRLSNRLHETSLLLFAEELSRRSEIVNGVQCPVNEEDLNESRREQSPLLDPSTGQPLRDSLGRIIDVEGRPIAPSARSLCTRTAHAALLRYLHQYKEESREKYATNASRPVSERDADMIAGRIPDVFVIAGADGTVLARLGHDRDNWHGPRRPNMNDHRIVALADTLGAQHGFIAWRDSVDDNPRLVRAAAAPIYGEAYGEDPPYLGVVLVGHRVSNEFAAEDSLVAQRHDVAYYQHVDGRVSLAGYNFTRSSRLQNQLTSLEYFRGDDKTPLSFDNVVAGQGSVFSSTIDGADILISSSTLVPATEHSPGAGILVLMSPAEATKFTQRLVLLFPLLALAFFILITAVTGVVFRQMRAALSEISHGLQEIIAGDLSYQWPVHDDAYLSDMAHQLNIVSALLQGKRPPDEDDVSEWSADETAGSKPAPRVQGLGGLRGRSRAKTEQQTDSSDTETESNED